MRAVGKEQSMSKECIICHLSGDPEEFVKLSAKGLSSLHVAAKSRGEEDKILHLNLQSPIHERCRKNYVSKQKIERWNACQENISCKQVKRTRSFDTQAPSSSSSNKQLLTQINVTRF